MKWQSLLRKIIGATRVVPGWWHSLGAAFHGKGETRKAVEAYRRALHLDAANADCRHALLTLLAYEAQTQGDQREAVALYREAAAINGSDPIVWYNLGIAYDALGDVSSAIDAMERACSLDSTNQEYQRWQEFLRYKKESSKGQP